MKWQEKKKPSDLENVKCILVYRLCCSFETGMYTNWQRIEQLSIEVSACVPYCILCLVSKDYLFRLWHFMTLDLWPNNRTSKQFIWSLCTINTFIYTNTYRNRTIATKMQSHQLLLCHIELILSVISSSPPKNLCVALNSKWSMANHNHNYNQHQRHGK